MAETTGGTGKITKQQWIILIGGGAAYVGYRWYKAKAGGTSSTASTTSTTGGLGTPIGVDANGNEVYLNSAGEEVDANGNPDAVATLATSSAGESYTNPNPIEDTGTTASGGASTDEQWTQNVINDLEGIGYDPETVATAISQYLASQPLTSAQVTIIRTAWAYEGRPPGEPNLPIIQQSGTTTTSGGGGGTVQGGNPPTSNNPTPGNYPPLKIGAIVQVPVLIENGQNWTTIGEKAGISAQHLESVNPGASGKVGTVISVPVLVEKSSQTWASIAQAWGISPSHLQQYNPQLA